ncbi:MAG: hypothetical protein AAB339_10650, partial [Elusimicrobiota bacterium]
MNEACKALRAAGCFLALLSPAGLRAEPYRLPPDLDLLALEGLRDMYRLDYSSAGESFRKMDSLQPAHPSGPLFMAGLHWWRRTQRVDIAEEDRSLEDAFKGAVRLCMERADRPETWGGTPAQEQLYKGMANGMMARWHIVNFNWVRAYYWGKKSRRQLRKAVKADPELYDAYLGLGIFDYYADVIPRSLHIPSLLFVRGDRKAGLEAVERTLREGRYNLVEARLFLINTYNEYERRPQDALRLAQELIEHQVVALLD